MQTDTSAGAPLAYAKVFLKNDQSYGVISNEGEEYQIALNSPQQ
jgi:hypothetical protein